MIRDFIIFESKGKNIYLYSFNKKLIIHLDALTEHYIIMFQKGINLEKWIKQLSNDGYFYKKKEYTLKEVQYYYSKFIFLKTNGFLNEVEIDLTFRYNKKDIKYYLANTNQVSFEVTNKCNLDCTYCIYGKYYTNRLKPNNTKLNIDAAKLVLDELNILWNSSLSSSVKKNISIGFYGGEPLLGIKFIREIVNYAKKISNNRNHFTFSMTTNGTLLVDNIDFLAMNDFNLTISLDGKTEENNKYRIFKGSRKSAFTEIINNISIIAKKYPKYFANNVSFNAVLHDKNSVKDLYTFFKNEYNKTPAIAELDIDSVNPTLKSEFLKMHNSISTNSRKDTYNTIETKELALGIDRDITQFLFGYTNYVKYNYLELLSENGELKKIPTGTCEPFSRKIFITANGYILPCERIGHQYQLGSIINKKMVLDYDKIADMYNMYFDSIVSRQCKFCYRSGSCGICMFKENISKEKANCQGFRNKQSFVEYFINRISYLEKRPQLYSLILLNKKYV